MVDEVVIPRRFNGPNDSANGGYACGLVAAALPGRAATVSLRLPPPLEVPLRRERLDDGSVQLLRDGQVVAEGRTATLDVEPPPAPSWDEADAATARYAGWVDHVFPRCFVCGPDRDEGDGLRIFPGAVEGRDDGLIASSWCPGDELADPIFAWAALDCPTAFACRFDAPAVLARLTVRRLGDVITGRRHVVTAWPIGRDGRKHHAGSAIHAEDGEPVAVGEALWIELRDPSAFGV